MMRPKPGTSSLVVAAFVGPGTVLTCAAAGVTFGVSLAWVLVFSTAAVFVLQSFTAASGILSGRGMGQALRESVQSGWARRLVFLLVVLGLWIGCAAFQTGNLLGAGAGLEIAVRAGLGLDAASTTTGMRFSVVAAATLAGSILAFDLASITRILTVVVAAMSLLFLGAAWTTEVNWTLLADGLMRPDMPEGSVVTVVALMGTTVVTYNLFLHPSACASYWKGSHPTRAWRSELLGMALFIPLGGLVSLAIMITGAGAGLQTAPTGIAEFATLLTPVAGRSASLLFSVGLLAAGLTSAVTAPLAAAAGITELFRWDRDTHPARFRMVWASVVLTGLFFALTGVSPLRLIVAAQAANGLLLPFIAGLVVLLAYRQRVARLPAWHLALGGVVVLICAGLGARTLVWVWSQF